MARKLLKIKRLHGKAWGVFSEWVRRRNEKNGLSECVSCKKKENWKTLNAGHFYHGKHWLSGMDERNVWPQCRQCNMYKSGNLIEYSEFLRKEYGPEIIDVLRELRHTSWKPTRQELEEIIAKYQSLLDGIPK